MQVSIQTKTISKNIIFITSSTIICSLVHFLFSVYSRKFVNVTDYGIYTSCLILATYMNYAQLGVLNSYNRDYPQLIGGNHKKDAEHLRNVTLTYILGTDNVLTAAINEGVKKVICLSTDKAAYPINAMGISKAMMEKVLVAKSKTVSPDRTTICGTRYGNVMASRGSVIPLFVEQVKSGQALTITDPDMTRFLMSLEEAVELVVFAFANAQAGDIMVQKSPASTIGDLAQALLELFDVDNEIRIIGTRHGEKLYETLLTKEEYIKAEDMGGFFRVPADKRDLNYDKYFVEGDVCLSTSEEYNSHNTYRLNVEEIKDKLLQLDYINNELSNWKKTGR
jgi:UDP-N-acetylglucosamine 4,6-dehydratase